MSELHSEGSTPGIVYLARVPPFMKPVKIRHIFSAYGELGRVFLQPEDEKLRKVRKKQGGSRKVRYTEGWVEFKKKRVAKRVAAALNANQIGGKKRSMYHDDLWSMRYLQGFVWSDLTEKINYDNAVASKKERMEVAQAKKENEFYRQSVGKTKALLAITERKKKREAEAHGGTAGASEETVSTAAAGQSASPEGMSSRFSGKSWKFKQVAPAVKRPKISMSKIFSRSAD